MTYIALHRSPHLQKEGNEYHDKELHMIKLAFILALSLIMGGGTMFSQSVEWSFSPSGFGFSQSASTTLISSVGEPFVGFSQIGCASVRSGSLFGNIAIVIGMTENKSQMPLDYTLYQNYPNPFNLSTTVRYDLPRATFVTLTIFDVLGRQISTIVEGEKPAGAYQVNVYVPNLSSGVYFYRLQARDYVKTKKFVLLR
jgi:Secretion system C-terminal sorting domain